MKNTRGRGYEKVLGGLGSAVSLFAVFRGGRGYGRFRGDSGLTVPLWTVYVVGALTLPAMIGLFTILLWVKSAEGIDSSNVINRIRLWWFALTRPALFVPVAPWLLKDELENVS